MNGPLYRSMARKTCEWPVIHLNGPLYRSMASYTYEWPTIPEYSLLYLCMAGYTYEWPVIPMNGPLYRSMAHYTGVWPVIHVCAMCGCTLVLSPNVVFPPMSVIRSCVLLCMGFPLCMEILLFSYAHLLYIDNPLVSDNALLGYFFLIWILLCWVFFLYTHVFHRFIQKD